MSSQGRMLTVIEDLGSERGSCNLLSEFICTGNTYSKVAEHDIYQQQYTATITLTLYGYEILFRILVAVYWMRHLVWVLSKSSPGYVTFRWAIEGGFMVRKSIRRLLSGYETKGPKRGVNAKRNKLQCRTSGRIEMSELNASIEPLDRCQSPVPWKIFMHIFILTCVGPGDWKQVILF